jgi:thiamine pyridinylase
MHRFALILLLLGYFGVLASRDASAGMLRVGNTASSAIECKADDGSGRTFDLSPGTTTAIAPIHGALDSVTCGSLVLGGLGVSEKTPDRIIMLNGQQTTTLRVALFPYLPTYPSGDLLALARMIELGYQRFNPATAVELSTNEDPYGFDTMKTTFATYDVVEVDTSILAMLIKEGWIVPTLRVGNPLPFAATAVIAPNGTYYGTPTWVCRDFLFSYDTRLATVTSLPQLLTYWQGLNTGSHVVADFTGRWQLYSMYVNAYVARYGYGQQQIDNALNQPADPATISDLASIVNACASAAIPTLNPCAAGVFHNDVPDGMMEPIFSSGFAATDMGFSERSFFIELLRSLAPTVIPMPYGPQPVPLMYVDALTYSKRCTGACMLNAQTFARYLTSTDVRKEIAFGNDLDELLNGHPWRHLLPATQDFYYDATVKRDHIYASVATIFPSAKPMPTSVDEQTLIAVSSRVCAAMVQQVPQLKCSASE